MFVFKDDSYKQYQKKMFDWLYNMPHEIEFWMSFDIWSKCAYTIECGEGVSCDVLMLPFLNHENVDIMEWKSEMMFLVNKSAPSILAELCVCLVSSNFKIYMSSLNNF